MADVKGLFGLPLATQSSRISTMRELYRVGDVNTALMVAAVIDTAEAARHELVLEEDEAEHGTLVHYESGLRPTSVLGPNSVLRIVKPLDEIAHLPFDHRVGFLLGLIDGATDVETILDTSAMPEEETMSVLHELLVIGVIRVA
jgi:hypothetical protein